MGGPKPGGSSASSSDRASPVWAPASFTFIRNGPMSRVRPPPGARTYASVDLGTPIVGSVGPPVWHRHDCGDFGAAGAALCRAGIHESLPSWAGWDQRLRPSRGRTIAFL